MKFKPCNDFNTDVRKFESGEGKCPDPKIAVDCHMQTDEYYRDFFTKRGCKRDCPPVEQVVDYLYSRA